MPSQSKAKAKAPTIKLAEEAGRQLGHRLGDLGLDDLQPLGPVLRHQLAINLRMRWGAMRSDQEGVAASAAAH